MPKIRAAQIKDFSIVNNFTTQFQIGDFLMSGRIIGSPENNGGWQICDGSLISQAFYSEYFLLVGYKYGGSVKLLMFAVPKTTQYQYGTIVVPVGYLYVKII